MDLEAYRVDSLPAANLLWLVDPPAWERALVVSGSPGPLRRAMEVRFPHVDAAAWPDPGDPLLPGSSGDLDLVIIDAADAERSGAFGTHEDPGAWGRLLDNCHRVLQPDGVLMILADNPLWFRRGGGGAGIPRALRRVRRPDTTGDLNAMSARNGLALIRNAAFRDLCLFFVWPAGYYPNLIIPAERKAAREFEIIAGQGSSRALWRSLIARLGFQEILHPSRLFIAVRG